MAGLTREGGKFRSFLLTALKNHLANEWDRSRAARRGDLDWVVMRCLEKDRPGRCLHLLTS